MLAALEFKCDVLWAMLDALYSAYVTPKPRAAGRLCAGGIMTEQAVRFRTARVRACRAACGLTQNEAQGGWLLLAPERVFKADAISHEILKRCTGDATLGAIVDDLAETFSTRRASASMPTW